VRGRNGPAGQRNDKHSNGQQLCQRPNAFA
jgi:hypothetical protein